MRRLGRREIPPPLVQRTGARLRAGSRKRFVVEEVAYALVEAAVVRSLEHHREVVAVAPVRLGRELLFHALVEDRSGKGVRDRDADVVGALLADEVARREDVVPLLAGIAELEEPGSADSVRAKKARGLLDLLDARSLVHRVE